MADTAHADSLFDNEPTDGGHRKPSSAESEQKAHVRRVLMAMAVVLVAVVVVVILIIKIGVPNHNKEVAKSLAPCDHPIYCSGKLLKTVQEAAIFPDSKTFVDMPLRFHPDTVKAHFDRLGENPTKTALETFVNDNFWPAGSELVVLPPSSIPDYTPDPAFAKNIADQNLRNFSLGVHAKWQHLIREYNFSGLCKECHSSLPLKHKFVVPGERFREFYYWDTFWIIHGLLVSGLRSTALDTIKNLLQLVQDHGFVPNGARCYFLDRSQPPLLTQMVALYANATGDTALIKEALPLLHQEHEFWMRSHSVQVKSASNGVTYTLNRYHVKVDGPRPESYREDIATRATVPFRSAEDLYSELAAGAETGWDYSSRWFDPSQPTNLSSIDTMNVVPADLNAILLRNEQMIAEWYAVIANDAGMASRYQRYAADREDAVFHLLYDDIAAGFSDYHLAQQRRLTTRWYVSNVVPLWVPSLAARVTKMKLEDAVAGAIMSHLHDGFPASSFATGQQWDFPNGWPPMQWFAERALTALGKTNEARTVVQRWIDTNYCGYQYKFPSGTTHLMFEKYNVSRVGRPGGGGEYTVQFGFGWTNGVVLRFMQEYGDHLTAPKCV